MLGIEKNFAGKVVVGGKVWVKNSNNNNPSVPISSNVMDLLGLCIVLV